MPRITSHSAMDIPERRRMLKADIFVSEEAMADMISHAAEECIEKNTEVMGLLAGHVYRDDDGLYAVVDKVVTSPLLSDDVSVRFDRSDMVPLFDALDSLNFDYVIVGWYHSHIGIGCFMSGTDVTTHSSAFGDEFGFAIVIDPVKEELKVFKSSKDGPTDASMVIVESDPDGVAPSH